MDESTVRLRADNAGYYTRVCIMLQLKKWINGKLYRQDKIFQ